LICPLLQLGGGQVIRQRLICHVKGSMPPCSGNRS
jgi:hypothetical protein